MELLRIFVQIIIVPVHLLAFRRGGVATGSHRVYWSITSKHHLLLLLGGLEPSVARVTGLLRVVREDLVRLNNVATRSHGRDWRIRVVSLLLVARLGKHRLLIGRGGHLRRLIGELVVEGRLLVVKSSWLVAGDVLMMELGVDVHLGLWRSVVARLLGVLLLLHHIARHRCNHHVARGSCLLASGGRSLRRLQV